jgi:hypothetical protein
MLPVAAVVAIKMKTRTMTMITKTTTATATTLWCFSKFWPMTSPLLVFPYN